MKNKINHSFKDNLFNFLMSLKKNNDFEFYPALDGLTNAGKNINLGFSCFALKCFFILDKWEDLENNEKDRWAKYLNSYQTNNDSKFPYGSFIDINYLNLIEKTDIQKESKRILKKLIQKNYKSKKQEVDEFIRAESKQAIASLYQIGYQNNINYKNNLIFPSIVSEYLDSLNWSKPWSSGAQFSGLCVFLETQYKSTDDYELVKSELIKFSDKLLDSETGCYFRGDKVSDTELINGAMKILTGLDWLGAEVHKPEAIIDTCLRIKPLGLGCDIVDIVYILYMCTKATNYRKKDILCFIEDIESLIFKHYYPEIGGFSYYPENSQKYYYGLNITKGFKTPDIHGTTLLLWAFSMINCIKDTEETKLNLIKP